MSTRRARNVTLLSLVVGVAATAIILYASVEKTAQALDLPQPAPAAQAVGVALHRVGLQPDALAAAGLSAAQVQAIVEHVVEHLTEGGAVIPHDHAVGETRALVAELEHIVRSAQGTPQGVANLQAARQALVAEETTRNLAAAALFSAATAGLPGQKTQVLSTIRGNAHWDQPAEFLVIDMSEAERVRLRDALANERISAANGDDPDPESQAFLAQVRELPAVAMAKANLDAHLIVVQSVWEVAVNQP